MNKPPDSGFVFLDESEVARLCHLYGNGEIGFNEFDQGIRQATRNSDLYALKQLILCCLGPLIDWFIVHVRKRPLFPGA